MLNDDTVPQINVFSNFLLKFFRFNYQLQQDLNAYINFPRVLTETELVSFIIKNTNKHFHYRDLSFYII